MAKDKTRYKYGDIIIRERKGRYYVYKLEKVNGKTRETYVGPLIDVVETYLKLKVGVYPPQCRGRDLNPGHRLERLDSVSMKRDKETFCVAR